MIQKREIKMIHVFIHTTIHQNKLQDPWNESNHAYTQNPNSEACNELSLSTFNYRTLWSLSEIFGKLKFHHLGLGRMKEESCVWLEALSRSLEPKSERLKSATEILKP